MSAFVCGRFQLPIAGQLILQGESATPRWFHASQPVELAFGKHALDIEFSSSSKSSTNSSGNDSGAAIGLYWSGPGFGLEPISARHLFHPQAAAPEEWLSRGMMLSRGLRCVACHQPTKDDAQGEADDVEGLPAAAPPSLADDLFSGGDWSKIFVKRRRAFSLRWLNDPASVNEQHRIPIFDLTINERHDLAAYLATLGGNESKNDTQASGDVERGVGLIELQPWFGPNNA